MQQIGEALEDLNQTRERPVGRLRIYARRLAAAAVIAPIWDRFLSTYPEIQLEVALGEAAMDIVSKGFDAGIDTRARVPTDMISTRVTGPMKIAVVASPAYFALRFVVPGHQMTLLPGSRGPWCFIKIPAAGRFQLRWRPGSTSTAQPPAPSRLG
jgi:DNA-binding transcriptional LysR family regulator